MKTSAHGLALIKQFEGFSPRAYQDTGGVWTIGWGHVKGVKKGQTCTAEQAEDWLREDLAFAEQEVSKRVQLKLEQHEFDALASFEFNTGGLMLMTAKGTERPSQLLKALNQGDRMGAANHLLDWIYDNGRVVLGLQRRRVAERRLFLGLV